MISPGFGKHTYVLWREQNNAGRLARFRRRNGFREPKLRCGACRRNLIEDRVYPAPMLNYRIWRRLSNIHFGVYYCYGCVCGKLKRPLIPSDLIACEWNDKYWVIQSWQRS